MRSEKADNLKRAILLAFPLKKHVPGCKCKRNANLLFLVDLSCFTVCEYYTLCIYKWTCLYRVVYTKPHVIYRTEDIYRLSGAALTFILFNHFTH